ncbi:MAG: hypothetical protein PVH61_00175 [Candidatus Aminicenantes bacterium]|jgi:hypothetical protein
MNGVDKKDENKVKPISEKPPIKWVFVLTAIVIISATFAIIISTFFVPTHISDNPIYQYRVTIVLACFVLSTISASYFATQARIRSTVGIMSITIVGPAALWLAALFILNNIVFKEDQPVVEKLSLPEVIDYMSRENEKREGWNNYCDWKQYLESIKRDNIQEEEFIRTMLSRVYYHGLKGYHKLKDVNLQTLLVYLGKDKRIKFQIIKGKREKEPTNIYMAALASFKHNPDEVFAHYIIRDEEGVLKDFGPIGKGVKSVPQITDCLIIALYNEALDRGDWIYVDLPKYVSDIVKNPAEMDLAILSTLPIEEFKIWEMRASRLIYTEPAPLLFREYKSSPAKSINKSFIKNLKSWFKFLDINIKQKENGVKGKTRDLLMKIIEEIRTHCKDKEISFSDLLEHQKFQNKRSINDKSLTNGIITIFRWD